MIVVDLLLDSFDLLLHYLLHDRRERHPVATLGIEILLFGAVVKFYFDFLKIRSLAIAATLD